MAGSVVLPKGYQPPRPPAPSAPDLAARIASLTPQQVRVLHMLRQGMLNKQIAHELGVGETTVKAHVSEILRKLNVVSRTQAVIEVASLDFDVDSRRSSAATSRPEPDVAGRATRCMISARSSAGFTGLRRISQSAPRRLGDRRANDRR